MQLAMQSRLGGLADQLPRAHVACCPHHRRPDPHRIAPCAAAPPEASAAGGILLRLGGSQATVLKVLQHCPALVQDTLPARITQNVGLLQAAGLDMADIISVLERTPAVASLHSDTKLRPVLEFLLQDLGLAPADVGTVVRRFPAVLTYGVQGHLRPHLAYLTSLGIQKAELPAMVLARPYILGSGIEHLVNYLLKCGLPRAKVGRVVRSWPFEYRLPAINANSILVGGDY